MQKGIHSDKSECIKVVYRFQVIMIELDADHLHQKKYKMVEQSTSILNASVVEMRRERGEVSLRRPEGDQPKTFTFDSVYDKE